MGVFTDWLEDAGDAVGGFVEDIVTGDIGSAFEDVVKGTFGLITLGYTNKYDDKFLPEQETTSVTYEDRKQSTRNPVAEQAIVYGLVRKGGDIIYIETSGENNKYLHLVAVVAAHECDLIHEIWFGDDLVATSNTGLKTGGSEDLQTFQIGAQDAGMFDVYAQLGAQTVSAADIQAIAPANWTSNHKVLGCTYVYFRLNYDRDFYRNGIPRISFLVAGRSVYDPRDLSTGYSANAALVALDYLRTEQGMNIPDADIDMQSFSDGADFADDLVFKYSAGANERRYLANGIARINTEPFKNMESILKASGAYLAYTVGKWRYIRAEYEAPTLTLSEADLAGGLSIKPSSGRAGRLNRVAGVFVHNETWERASYPAMEIASYIANDGEVFESTLDFGFVTSAYQAQRLAKLAIERSRYGLTVQATFKFKALQLTVGDRVYLDLDTLGITNRAFMVIEMELDMQGGVSLVLREDVSGVYTWTESDNKQLIAPPSINVGSADPLPAESFTISEELYQTSTSNVIKVRILLSWSDPVNRTQTYDVQYRESGGAWKWVDGSIFGTEASIDDVKAGGFDFRIRPINEIGWVGAWANYSGVILGKLTPPPDIESLFIADEILTWTYPNAPLDLAGFEVRTHQGDRQTWADATPLHVGLLSASRFDVRGAVADTTTFLVKAVDTSGVYSVNAAAVVVNVGDSLIQNVIFTYDYEANTWPGTITNGSINVSNEIEADQVGGFYNPDPNSIFYDQVGSNDFYSSEFKKLEYEFTYTVAAQDVGVQLSLDYTVVGNSAQLEYIPPNGGTTYTPFSGVLPEVVAGQYKFKLIIPSQFGGSAPKITDLLLNLDVPDITERLDDVAISETGTRLPITKAYRGIGFVTLTMQTDGSGVTSLKVSDKNHTLGPLVYAYNSSGTAVNTTIDAFIRGY